MKSVIGVSIFSVLASISVGNALAADAPIRKASTILSSPFVWPNDSINDMVSKGAIPASTVAMVQSGAGLPWETQQSNKKLCAVEQLTALPTRIELKVGDTFPVSSLVFQSSAFGSFYYDASVTRKWKYENEVVVFEKLGMVLRALMLGEAELQVDSLCKSKRLASPAPTIRIPVIVVP